MKFLPSKFGSNSKDQSVSAMLFILSLIFFCAGEKIQPQQKPFGLILTNRSLITGAILFKKVREASRGKTGPGIRNWSKGLREHRAKRSIYEFADVQYGTGYQMLVIDHFEWT